MAIGQDLLDVGFADLVHNLALAIAEGQLALDQSSIQTLQFLINNNVDIVTEITDVITAVPRSVTIPGNPPQTVEYTGAQVTSSGAAPVTMSLFQAGITPTFYQFTEASIEVKISITARQATQETTSGGTPLILRLFASPVDYRTSNTFTYSAQGASVMRAIIRPVPAPSRVTPRIVTVDALTQPPAVTSVS